MYEDDDYYSDSAVRARREQARRNGEAADREARRITTRIIALALEFSKTPVEVQALFDRKGNDEGAVRRALYARKGAHTRAEKVVRTS